MPIMHCNKPKRVLGLFQLINKFDDLPFTKNDENFVQAFAIFCGMGINNVRMYEKTVLTMAKQQVTLEVLRYNKNHISSNDNCCKYIYCMELLSNFYKLKSISFSYHATAPQDEALKLTRQKIPSAAALQLKSLAFDDFGLQNDETLQVRQFVLYGMSIQSFIINYIQVNVKNKQL